MTESFAMASKAMSKILGNTARKKATHYRDYLRDILRYAEMGERITMGIDFETFCSNDEKTLAAISDPGSHRRGIKEVAQIPQE
jgi:hypothetical protein